MYSHVFACIRMYRDVSVMYRSCNINMYRSYVSVMYRSCIGHVLTVLACIVMYRVRVRNGHVSAMYRDVSIETICIVY